MPVGTSTCPSRRSGPRRTSRTAFPTAGAASAGTYIVDPLEGTGATVTGTITTDGTLGTLGFGNFTGIDLTVSDGVTSQHLGLSDLLNLVDYLSTTTMTATSTGLFFDFSSANAQGFAVFNFDTGAGYCFTASGTSCIGVEHSAMLEVNNVFYQGPVLSGVVRMAHIDVGAVPEPASWALMLGGFGLVGGALRSRRRTAVSFG